MSGAGKSDELSDIVEGRFAEMIENERIVHRAVFEANDPGFGGVMTLTSAGAAANARARRRPRRP